MIASKKSLIVGNILRRIHFPRGVQCSFIREHEVAIIAKRKRKGECGVYSIVREEVELTPFRSFLINDHCTVTVEYGLPGLQLLKTCACGG